ncbi:response regulator [Vulgatibacter sp.]|uniref:response regulator n=1 Tax=Vulgatibacter sp. TaxID=1971226 RepID=UPI003567DE25
MIPRILVVDDDADILALLEDMLSMEGYEVCTAANGQLALQELEKRRPQLILLDMKMPVMDGRAFARCLRERHGDAIPFLVLTAAADVRNAALEVQAHGWLGKPFDLDELLRTVAGQLAAARCPA